MSQSPHVAIVAASLDILGGQGVQARALVDSLRADGQRVMFVPINPRFPRPCGGLRHIRGVRTLVNQSLYLPGLARLAAVDVAHVFSASYASFLLAPLPAMAVARALNKRVVLHYHSGEADDHLANWGALVHPWLRLAHYIVVPSEYLRQVFARYGHTAHVIPNVVDLSRFAYRARRPLGARLLSTRNLEPHYRVDMIVQAYAQLKPLVPEATLTIAGYGSEEPRLRLLVSSAGLADVRFLGRVEPEDMPRVYDNADIFLNASVVDNQPVSILEAFAAGLPVVSTPTGDIGALVRHHDTGLLVPPFEPGAIARAIQWLLANPDRAAGFAERAHASIARYTWPAVRDAWAAMYRTPSHATVVDSWLTNRHSQ
jgi:glycosyltransferase involved in cell wall biosynthesis